ncbi:COBRA-like protein 7 [Amborella trichopoda]|uniref:COBRA C-terminal domain-containing protein n=1 Tax=Amborella trichopoda TaxID=13333 RepID=U5D317_AMBTC|nr:COBRA-like protein 7 [Amborella trichopoda]ERN16824.1 hypothetical protein AMTR_s00057p00111550 [Amborella trichopoda]|eukprot:XP_006855357.1 COBRA-like protein 7 [Amborella trichopoda]
MGFHVHLLLLASVTLILQFQSSISQTVSAPSPSINQCNGIFLSYSVDSITRIYPFLSDPSAQPYAFSATATLINTGEDDLKSWQMFIGFKHKEILVSASQAVLSDGADFPAEVGNGTFINGFPQTDLKNAIDTAGDVNQIEVKVTLTGTEFGVAPPAFPMPSNISLANEGYNCQKPTVQNNLMYICCAKDQNAKPNITQATKFSPRQDGDLTIDFDVLQSYQSNYLAQVVISNENPLGRLDHWNLTWDWMRGEFIQTMRGAYTLIEDSSDCIFGEQGAFFQGLDFTKVMNCQRTPTIVDLPLDKTNDTNIGLIPFCCRNGTLLPPHMDPSKSKAAFQLQVYKMPPDLNRTMLYPPQNWKISGILNPDYKCGHPVRVDPTLFPDTSGLRSFTSAIASWRVVCNITNSKATPPRCCVSFSSFYNESVIPCKTCACGCPSPAGQACNASAPALFLPSEALLVPFENRTRSALAWADLKHFHVPNPLPCGDNCGVSINWHVLSDYNKGWSARITLFNWDATSFEDWFVAVELDKAVNGFEGVYSFNGSAGVTGLNNTIFMQGKPGLNYLIAEDSNTNPPNPGKQQTVISFTKKNTPGINVVRGDGFPTKFFFNGEECSLPTVIPSSGSVMKGSLLVAVLAAALTFLLMDQL